MLAKINPPILCSLSFYLCLINALSIVLMSVTSDDITLINSRILFMWKVNPFISSIYISIKQLFKSHTCLFQSAHGEYGDHGLNALRTVALEQEQDQETASLLAHLEATALELSMKLKHATLNHAQVNHDFKLAFYD